MPAMSPSALADLFEKNPTTPFKITMASGDEIVVAEPRRTLITELELYVGTGTGNRPGSSPFAQYARIVSIPNINIVQRIDSRPPPTGERRRRRSGS